MSNTFFLSEKKEQLSTANFGKNKLPLCSSWSNLKVLMSSLCPALGQTHKEEVYDPRFLGSH